MDVPLNLYRWWLSYVNNQWHKWFQRHRILYVPLKIAFLWLNGSTVRHHWRILEKRIAKNVQMIFFFTIWKQIYQWQDTADPQWWRNISVLVRMDDLFVEEHVFPSLCVPPVTRKIVKNVVVICSNLQQKNAPNLTSSFLMMTSFLRIFIAYSWLVAFSRHKMTLPKVPLPSTLRNSKFSKVWKRNRTKIKYFANKV